MNSSLGKRLIREGIEYAPILYEKGTKRIKNKIIQSALLSDFVNFAFDQDTRLTQGNLSNYFVNAVNIVNSIL